MKKYLVSILLFVFGFVLGNFLFINKFFDETGRQAQFIYTIDHILKSNNIALKKEEVLKSLLEMYSKDDMQISENKISVHRLEFYFENGKYIKGKITK